MFALSQTVYRVTEAPKNGTVDDRCADSVGVAGLTEIVLGVLFWTGDALTLRPAHSDGLSSTIHTTSGNRGYATWSRLT